MNSVTLYAYHDIYNYLLDRKIKLLIKQSLKAHKNLEHYKYFI